MFCGRSKVVEAKQPRGGVAVYRKIHSGIDVDIQTEILRDAVVFRIRDTRLVIAALYIPPSNSTYYDEIYFKNCELIMDHFNDMQTLIVGDLNSRMGDVERIYPEYDYKQNPDEIINRSGKVLRETCIANPTYVLLNGYTAQISIKGISPILTFRVNEENVKLVFFFKKKGLGVP